MDSVKGFRKNNVGVITESFKFVVMPDFEVASTRGRGVPVHVQGQGVHETWGTEELKVSFDERDRKAVADLFRKMADSLDGEEPFKPGTTGKVAVLGKDAKFTPIVWGPETEYQVVQTMVNLRLITAERAREYFGLPAPKDK